MRLPQLTGFFRHLRGRALRSEFIRVTKPFTHLTSSILRSPKCCGVLYSREWSQHTVPTRRSAICWISALLGIPMSFSCHGVGNCVTISLPTSCLPKNSELRWLHGMVDSLLLRATAHSSSCFNSTPVLLTQTLLEHTLPRYLGKSSLFQGV